jgi:hypothetical protein
MGLMRQYISNGSEATSVSSPRKKSKSGLRRLSLILLFLLAPLLGHGGTESAPPAAHEYLGPRLLSGRGGGTQDAGSAGCHGDFGTDLHNPDFAKIAEGSGLLGLSAKTADDVAPMLEQALSFDGPALVEIPVPRQELSMPPTITYEEAKGFSLFMMKAVLSGRADEVIDLAKVNLLR